jgi:hypothetical protein
MSPNWIRPVVVLAVIVAGVSGAGAGAKEGGRSKKAPPAKAVKTLDRVLERICATGSCRGGATVHIWRDPKGRARLLVYQGAHGSCSHPPINYYDPKGKLLLADGTGPREPEEWNDPKLKRIQKMKLDLDLHDADTYGCP